MLIQLMHHTTLLTWPTARNNLRAMRKGDLAFFYHSNCKTPGVVGVMEIVQEHSPDGEDRIASRDMEGPI